MAKKRKGRGPTRLVAIWGETRTLGEWCAEFGVPHNTVLMRVNKLGWDWERAIVKKPLKRGPERGVKLGPKLGRVRGYKLPVKKVVGESVEVRCEDDGQGVGAE